MSYSPIDNAHIYSDEVKTPSPYPNQSYMYPNMDNIRTRLSPSQMRINEERYLWDDIEKLTYIAHTHMNPEHAYLKHMSSHTPGFVLSKYAMIFENYFCCYLLISRIVVDDLECVEYWRSLMKDRTVKLIFIKFTITDKDNSHANWIIIDKPRKVVEFFDPHGHHNMERVPSLWPFNYVEKFKDDFQCKSNFEPTCFIPRKYTVLKYLDSCPKYGFQYYEGIIPKKPDDREGYCSMWCLFLLELRLANKHIGTKDVQEQFINTIGKDKTQKMLGELFRDFIRKYNAFLLELVPKLWWEDTKMDVD